MTRRQLLARAAAVGTLWSGADVFAQGSGPMVFKPESKQPPPTQAPQADLSRGLELETIQRSFWDRPRELVLQRQETGETVRAVYWQNGAFNADGYWRICALLRDVKQNIMTTMDPGLLDVLRGILGYYEQFNWNKPLVVLSGYRTIKTNNGLEGAARNSMHLYGRAADIYIPGIPTLDLARLGLYFQRGGVGFYPDNGFVHLDTGTVRTWVKGKR
jgi:uncharacterized protein YcbK (DUF882 family)